MDVMKIRAFLYAVNYKSLSKAAEEFNYTPSALSHMTDALEAELKVKLLLRTSKGVELTEHGKLLYDKLKAVVDAEDAMIAAAKEVHNGVEQTLRIGTYSSISLHLLPPLLKDFRKEHPEVEVSIIVENSLRGWIKEGKADVVISDAQPTDDEIRIDFKKDPYVAVVPSDVFCGRQSVDIEELYDYPYIQTIETAISNHADITRFKETVLFQSVDDATVLSMVKEGIGVAILPLLSVGKRQKGIRVLKLCPNIHRTLGVSYNKKQAPESVKKFLRFLKNQNFFTK